MWYVFIHEKRVIYPCTSCLPVFLSFVSAPYTRVWSFGYSHLSTVGKPAEASLDML